MLQPCNRCDISLFLSHSLQLTRKTVEGVSYFTYTTLAWLVDSVNITAQQAFMDSYGVGHLRNIEPREATEYFGNFILVIRFCSIIEA